MSLIIIAFKNAPIPNAEWKAKDEALDNEIRKKTTGKTDKRNKYQHIECLLFVIEIYNRNSNKTNLDANAIWQQVVTSLNELPSIRDSLPIGGGFISKYDEFLFFVLINLFFLFRF